MEYRLLGRSGLKVSVFSFGAMTFGGAGRFAGVGETKGAEAKRQIDMCLDAGVNLFDTADMYSEGQSEEVLAEALGARRPRVLIATKFFGQTGPGPNDQGASRHHIIEACEASLRRLKTDYIDLYQIHNQDLLTPAEETLRALDDLVRAGKVRYIGSSNHSGWTKMKALATSEQLGFNRYVSQQIQYSLLEREAEAGPRARACWSRWRERRSCCATARTRSPPSSTSARTPRRSSSAGGSATAGSPAQRTARGSAWRPARR
jgi:aryl-alcohol dehydrogenase-like predicted oxidoreductase